jgi:hypothetical protein
MASTPIQTAFNAGEISERLRGRLDTPLYGRGLARCENMKPTPQGSLLGRAGGEYMDPVGAAKARFITFRSASQDDYLLVLTHLKMKIYSLAGQVEDSPGGSLLDGVWTEIDGDGYAYASASGGSGEVQSGEQFSVELKRYLTVTAAVTQTFVVASATTLILQFNVTAKNFRVSLTGGGGVVYLNEGMSGTGYRGYEIAIPAGTYTLRFQSTSKTASGAFTGLTAAVAGEAQADTVTPWPEADLWGVQYVSDTAEDRVLFAHRKHPPQKLTLAGWVFAAIVFTNAPAEWTGTTYPGVIELFAGRLWFAMGRRVWASKSGEIFDFGVSTPTVASDRIDVKVATKGRIEWMQGQKLLLLGTDLGEHSVVSAGGVVTPLDIDVAPESAFGSAPVQALHVGDEVLYVTRDRKHIRTLRFSQEANGWISKALTFVADHLTKDGIKEIHFAKSPDPVIFVLLQTGELRACTYDRAEEVLAWWRLEVGGVVQSCAVAEGAGGSDLWIAVTRTSGLLIERIPQYEDVAVYVDSAVQTYASAAGVVTGLGHLEGELVRVIIDEILVLDDAVVAGGTIDLGLDYASKKVVVGLRYSLKATTLPKNVKGGKVRNAKIGVALHDSALPKINGKRPPERDPAIPFDEATGRVTGKIEVGNLGWDGEGAITIEQDQPFRTEILALFSNTQANDI